MPDDVMTEEAASVTPPSLGLDAEESAEDMYYDPEVEAEFDNMDVDGNPLEPAPEATAPPGDVDEDVSDGDSNAATAAPTHNAPSPEDAVPQPADAGSDLLAEALARGAALANQDPSPTNADPGVPDTPPVPAPTEAAPPASPPEKPATPRKLADALDDDESRTQFVDDYGEELGDAVVTIADKVVQKTLAVREAELVKRMEATEQRLAEKEAELAQRAEYYQLLNAVAASGHPDVYNITHSDAWHTWLEQQDPAVQRLGNSWLVDDATLLVRLYKADRAKEKAAVADAAAAEKHQKAVALHSSTLPPSSGNPGKADGLSEEEIGWNLPDPYENRRR